MFRNILDSTKVEIDPKVTCLVGKNESGKSAFLTALWRLNPARTKQKFSVSDNYPAWLEKRHRNEGVDQDQVKVIEAEFEWEESDVKLIDEKFGEGVAKVGAILKISKQYDNEFRWTSGCDGKRALKNFLDAQELPTGFKGAKDFDSLSILLSEKAKETTDEAATKQIANAQAALKALWGDQKNFDHALWVLAEKRIPKFLYFADYSRLPYSVKIDRVLKGDDLKEEEATARALLVLGGTENDYMLNPDYERRKRELENVANVLSEDVKKYWTQNPELRVQPDITQRTENKPNGHISVLDELKIRIWDSRHSLSLPFTEHSAGFQWFFSFLAAFSEYEYSDPPVVILLDEPAVGLHAKAQADFLRFIEQRLTKRCQVIYTTHSPFMVQPGHLERVRLVEDVGPEKGSTVSRDVLSRDRDTLFPLQGALGYDLVQHLFVAENNLVVEGTSDYAYLKIISDFLQSAGRKHLDPRWSIIPVGGADLIPTFVALLGNHLKVTVVVDSKKGGQQRLHQLAKDGYLEKQRLILLHEILDANGADIEDLFKEDEYLALYNKAFTKKLKGADLKGTDPIVTRIARHEGVDRYDHGRPADVLLRDRDAVLKTLSDETLKGFEKLFDHINKTIKI
jgi:predicted ATP-dependent endonuclease of OLD family